MNTENTKRGKHHATTPGAARKPFQAASHPKTHIRQPKTSVHLKEAIQKPISSERPDHEILTRKTEDEVHNANRG